MKPLLNNRNIRSFQFLSLASVILFSMCLSVQAQSTSVRSQIAELNQRFVELEQKYNLMKLEVENLTADNNRLRQELAAIKSSKSSKDVETTVNAKLNNHKQDTERYVKQQYDKLLVLLSQKLDNVSTTKPTSSRSIPTTQTTAQTLKFNSDFPKDGQIYHVQSGDTLSKIAKQFGSRVKYIQNANQISNPNSLQVGQKLFVPIDNK